MQVFATGGIGYISPTSCLAPFETGYELISINSLYSNSEVALHRVREIAAKPLRFVCADGRNRDKLDRARDGGTEAVIHFARLREIAEICQRPINYFKDDLSGTTSRLQARHQRIFNDLAFGSSIIETVEPKSAQLNARSQLHATDPYRFIKLPLENVIWGRCEPKTPNCSESQGLEAMPEHTERSQISNPSNYS